MTPPESGNQEADMKKSGKVGLWALGLSMAAGTLTVILIGPRKIKKGWESLRRKPRGGEMEIHVP